MSVFIEFSDAIFLTLVDPAPQTTHYPSLVDFAHDFKVSERKEDFMEYIARNITDEQLEYTQYLKQGTDECKRARKGRITASISSEILHLKEGNSCVEKILGNVDHVTSVAIRHGLHYEAVARAQYQSQTKHEHKDQKIEEYGLFIDKEFPCLAASPDGVVTCNCHSKKLIEIKCSYKHRDLLPNEIPTVDSSYHVKHCNGKLALKKTSPWFFQVQFQMGVIKVDRCDFVLHTLHDIAIMTINFDESVWEALKKKSLAVFMARVFPRLTE